MRVLMMRFLYPALLALGLATSPALAQDEGEDREGRGYLQSLIEDNLSVAGRQVRITGFAGALSSTATLDTLTIADDQGIWLELRDVALDWTRTALLRGRVQVNSLTAAQITLSRLPEGEAPVTPEDAEATPFSLPELPVSINIGEVSAETLTLGAPILGEEIRLSLRGSLSLGGGEGTADIDVARLDGRGEITLDASFDNESRVLALDLTLDEASGGIAATLLNLPDSPAIALTLQGEGPLDDYTADLALATDGTDRLTGRVALTGTDGGGLAFDAALDGDLTPLMTEEYRAFFGGQSTVDVAGRSGGDGALEIDRLRVSAAQLDLDGTLALDATGWPTRFQLTGEIGAEDGPVRLPVAGPPVTLGRATLDASFDAATGEDWQAGIALSGLSQPDLSLDSATLTGRGTLTRDAPRRLTAEAGFDVSGLDLADPALAEAAGTALSGRATLDWTQGSPLLLRALRVVSGAATLTAEGQIRELADGFPVSGTATLEAPDLARFAAISGQDLAGAAEATLDGSGSLLGGSFDLTLEARTDGLALGIEQVDPLIGAPATLSLAAKRDTDGTTIDRFRLRNAHLDASAEGALNSDRGTLDVTAALDDLARADTRLSGPVDLRTQLDWQAGGDVTLSQLVAEAMGARITGTATLSPEAEGLPASGRITAQVADLARFAAITGQPLEGRIDARIEGEGVVETQSFDLTFDGTTDGVVTGIDQVDGVIAGRGTLRVDAAHDGRETILRELRLNYDAARATASGRGVLEEQTGEITFDANVPDLSVIDPRLEGPADAAGTLARDADGEISVAGLAAQLMGAEITATGTVQPDPAALAASGDLTARIADLSRFAEIAGRPLDGRIEAQIMARDGSAPGTFDGTIDASTDGLVTGIPQVDGIVEGRGTLHVDAAHDGRETTLRELRLNYDAATVTASGAGILAEQSGEVTFDADISELSVIDPRLDGPAAASGTLARAADGEITATGLAAEVMGATLDVTGTVQPDPEAFTASGDVTASIAELSRFAAITGQQRLRGSLDLSLSGDARDGANAFSVTTSLEGRDLVTGIAQVDQLLGGRASLAAEAGRTPQRIEITNIDLETAQIRLDASGDGAGGPVSLDARLANLGLFAPGFSGPLTASGTVRLQGPEARRITLDIDATGPGGTTAALSGEVIDYAQRLDLAAAGRLPLALVNGLIQPRALGGTAAYDLRVQGPPALASVTGTVTTQGTTVALPNLGFAIDDLSGTARLANSRVETDFTAAMREGGRLSITGPIALTPGFEAGLRIALSDLVLSDGRLYTTTANGTVSLDGPLTGGGRIGGTINLGETNLRIPSGGGSPASVTLPGLVHVNESPAVRLTRQRAGLIETGSGNGARPFDLDITINAPRRIFVRGRGLDAELGGRLRIAGTTRDVAPDGFFELIRGRFDILGKRLSLTEGRVTMRGSFDPFLRFAAETQSADTTIRIIVEGLASDPEIIFESTPELPQEEVVSRLIFGRGLDSISPLQAAQMASAVSTLTGRSDNDLMGRLRSAVGLADLDVTQTEEGDTEVSAGAYLSDDIYTEVTADSAGRQQINLNYDVTRSVTVRGSTSNEGDTGVGVFFERDY
ncbi:translocation/assembly module TamB domain-containing protein [Roseovarius sp. D22-M7]|uniref:translocation/assembly module TamB domain-containing protein n=1 Tax=Roseovarius sp. D22-M7 TaxID=3127116 RepID=UPI0030100653